MPKLIFHDGTVKEVNYNQAAKIYQILKGEVEPENDKQTDYVMQVKKVLFENNKVTEKRPWERKQHG